MCHVELCRTSINLCWMTESKQRAQNHPGELGHVGHCFSQYNHTSFIRAKSRNQQGRAQSVIHPFPRFYVIILMLQSPEVFSNSLVDASLLHSRRVSIPMPAFSFPPRIRKRSVWSPKLIPPPVTLVPAPPSCPRPRFDPSCFWITAPSPGCCHLEHNHAWRMSPENTDLDTWTLKEFIKL